MTGALLWETGGRLALFCEIGGLLCATGGGGLLGATGALLCEIGGLLCDGGGRLGDVGAVPGAGGVNDLDGRLGGGRLGRTGAGGGALLPSAGGAIPIAV